MASAGPNSPSTGADDSAVGTVSWATPSNIGASDNTRATAATTAGQVTHYLKATGFGFSIPSGTIDGVVVEIERSQTAQNVLQDNVVKLVKGGAVSGNNKASGTLWSGAEAYFTYGASNDTWGASLTPSDVNASDFGVVLSVTNAGSQDATARVDHVRVTVYYTEGAGGTQYSQSASGALSSSGALVRRTDRGLAGGITSSGALARQVAKPAAGTLSFAGTMTREAARSVAGVLAFVGEGARSVQRALGGTLTASGGLTRHTAKQADGAITFAGVLETARVAVVSLAGTLGFDGVLTRSTITAMTGAVSLAGAVNKRVSRPLAGTLNPSGVLETIKTFMVLLAGTLGMGGELSRYTGKATEAVLGLSGELTRAVTRALAGDLTPAGEITKRTAVGLSGSLSPSGVLETIKTFMVALAGTLGLSGGLSRHTNKVTGAVLGPSGALARAMARALAGDLTPAGEITKQTAVGLSGSLTPEGDMRRQVMKVLLGVLAVAGALSKQTSKVLNGALTFAGGLVTSTGAAAAAIRATFRGMWRGMWRKTR